MSWVVCQIGGREHYAIPRALEGRGELGLLATDFFVPPGSLVGRLPRGQRLRDRWHSDLEEAEVWAPNLRLLGFEARERLQKGAGWSQILRRNALFQSLTIRRLELQGLPDGEEVTLFSYSYAAGELFRYGKKRGWRLVLGQIDPGPAEERIVAAEHDRYPGLGSSWSPVPVSYWESWRKELALADHVVVNSEWSRQCLLKEGVAEGKIESVPLVYKRADHEQNVRVAWSEARPLRLLFLGKINLRKGIARLLEAMRLLKDEAVELVLVGASEIDEKAWEDLPKVKWLGPVPRSEVGKHYRESDVFLLPTLSDGYALTQLEALSYGLPGWLRGIAARRLRKGSMGGC